MTPEEKIQVLNRIYEMPLDPLDSGDAEAVSVCSCIKHNYRASVCGSDKAAAFLCSCLFDEDYLVRSRAFGLAERRPDLKMNTAFLHTLFGDEEREWQLRALSALGKVGDKATILALKPLLFQEEKPLLLRGTLWVFVTAAADIGKEILDILAAFLLSPYVSYLKTAFVADAVALGVAQLEEGTALWQEYCDRNAALAKTAAFYRQYCSHNSLLQVYPYPDYLTKQAQKQEISAKEMKQALFFKKHPVKNREKTGEKDLGDSTN